MRDMNIRYPTFCQPVDAGPRPARPLTAAAYGQLPQPQDRLPERLQQGEVPRYAIVLTVTTDHSSQPSTHFGDRPMATTLQLHVQRAQLRAQAFRYRLSPYGEPPVAGLATDVGEPKEVEPFRFLFPSPLSISGRKATELDQTGFGRVEGQRESRQPRFEGFMKTVYRHSIDCILSVHRRE